MGKFIYEVCLKRGKSNPDYFTFYKNISALNAKAPDFGGINNMCIIGHHIDANTLQMLCSDGIKKESDVTVEEITKESLDEDSGHHKLHTDIVKNYYLPYDTYPNIE